MHTCVDLMAIMYNQEETNRLDGRAYIYRSLSASELFAFYSPFVFGGSALLWRLICTMMDFIQRSTKKRHSEFTDSSSASETGISRRYNED